MRARTSCFFPAAAACAIATPRQLVQARACLRVRAFRACAQRAADNRQQTTGRPELQQATNRTRRRAGRSRAITRGLANRRIKQQPNECDAGEQTTCTGRRAGRQRAAENAQQQESTHTAAEHMQRASCSRQCAADGVQQSSRAHPKRKPTQCDARGQATRSRRRANRAAAAATQTVKQTHRMERNAQMHRDHV